MTVSSRTITAVPGRGWTLGLWAAQALLAAFYGMTAAMHGLMSQEAMVQGGVAWAASAPLGLIRFIGLMEFLGAVGLILPAATRILPGLTPLAALGLVGIQVLAIPFHISRGEFFALPFNIALLALAAFVAWGRSRKAPIAPRG